MTSVVEVDHAPNLTGLLARAVATSPGRGGRELPDTTVVLRDVRIDRDALADYAEVCRFTLTDRLPATYLHLLAFPLSVQIMAGRDFPFVLAGLVHVRNRITQHRPVTADEVVDLSVHLADLRPHPKGQQFDVRAEATVDDETVWSSTSTYLNRGGGQQDAPTDDAGAAAVDVGALPATATWKVPGDIGRRYGAVSGDRNPIHMSALAAKAFGFPKAIAHGMWMKARSLAALEGRLPDAFEVDVVFKLPVLLPATVEYATQAEVERGSEPDVERGSEPDVERWQFGLRSRSGKPHLAGVVTPA